MKNKFVVGMITGILFGLLIFVGVYAVAEKRDRKAPGIENVDGTKDTDNSDNDNDKDKDKEEGNNSSGNLLQNNSTISMDLIDEKASYIMNLINAYFLYDVTEEDYKTAIYRALLAACDDPYSCYYTPEEYASMQESSSGIYCGIGCLVQQNIQTMLITVVRPFDGSPAAIAGIRAGDVLYKVDGEDITGMDVNLVVSKLKGVEGTDVTITVYREGESDYLDFVVTRAYIEVETVTYEKLTENGHKIGLIAVTEFEEVTSDQFEAALEDLKKWGMEGLVIDMRDNPGGLLDVVVDMLDPLLPEGLTVYMQDKNGNRRDYKSDAAAYDIPMAVLINGNSASASEIFAGAVQDYKVATVVGTQSFGKGIVQSIFPLSDGSAAKMTIADYYTPLGRNIHGEGITPDVIIELPEGTNASTVTREDDTQLAGAIDILLKEIR